MRQFFSIFAEINEKMIDNTFASGYNNIACVRMCFFMAFLRSAQQENTNTKKEVKQNANI